MSTTVMDNNTALEVVEDGADIDEGAANKLDRVKKYLQQFENKKKVFSHFDDEGTDGKALAKRLRQGDTASTNQRMYDQAQFSSHDVGNQNVDTITK